MLDHLERTVGFLYNCVLSSRRVLRGLGYATAEPQDNRLYASAKVQKSNKKLEVVSWFAEHTLTCRSSSKGLVIALLEDFGGHHVHGPTSPWCLAIVAPGCQRCRTLHDLLCMGLPRIGAILDKLYYDGPLHGTCPFPAEHKPTHGSNPPDHSSSSVSLGVGFWEHCVAGMFEVHHKARPFGRGLYSISNKSTSFFSGLVISTNCFVVGTFVLLVFSLHSLEGAQARAFRARLNLMHTSRCLFRATWV